MKSIQENQSQTTNSLSSAFDQEGQGTTMSPPNFSLKTGEGETSQLEEKGGFDIQGKYEALVKEYKESKDKNKLEQAARLLMRYYGMYDEELVQISIVDKLDASAITAGKYGPNETQYLKVSVETLKAEFSFVARTLGHEYQHMLYKWNNTDGNKAENEFLAYYWEVFGNTFESHQGESKLAANSNGEFDDVPKHTLRKELEWCIFKAQDEYFKMPKELREKHADAKLALDVEFEKVKKMKGKHIEQ